MAHQGATAIAGALLAGGGALAASNWVVRLTARSSGEGQSAGISNMSISAIASPSASNLLYPGGTGDVVVTISNPNPYPVNITYVQLPTNTTYANMFVNSSLSSPQAGCAAGTPSGIMWNYSSATSGSSHSLTSPLSVAGSGSLTVTFVNDAIMGASAPAACAGTYFSLPSFTGDSYRRAATVTPSPAIDSWTS